MAIGNRVRFMADLGTEQKAQHMAISNGRRNTETLSELYAMLFLIPSPDYPRSIFLGSQGEKAVVLIRLPLY